MDMISKIPNEILLQITDKLNKRDRVNFSMVLDRDPDSEYTVNDRKPKRGEEMCENCYADESNVRTLFGHEYCKDLCDHCVTNLDDGFCYLKFLTKYRLPIAMVLGSYVSVEKLILLRTVLKNSCMSDFHLSSPGMYFETKNGLAASRSRLDRHGNHLDLYAFPLHLSKNRYSYGDEDHWDPVFSPEEMQMFNDQSLVTEDMEETLDDELMRMCPENNNKHNTYYVVGSSMVSFIPKDELRDILSSGYTPIEEASIIANFKRRLDLGIPVDEAMKSSVGLDNWTIKRHGMSGVKRFIESKICDIARAYGKKPRRKLNQPQLELLEEADRMNSDYVLFGRNVESPSLKSSISRSSLNTIREDVLRPIVGNKVKMTFNKNEIDPESMVAMSDLGDVIADIGSKLGKDLDKMENLNKMDKRLDDMLLKAERVQGIYDELLSHGNTKKDPLILKRSIESIHSVYTSLVDDEIESLKKYGEATSSLVKEYEDRSMFDKTTEIMRNEKIIQDINNLIEQSGEQPAQRCGGEVPLIEVSDESDFSEVDDKMSFLFQQSEMEKRNEEVIVNSVEDIMSLDTNGVRQNDTKFLTRADCNRVLFSNFGITTFDEQTRLNRTKRELFRFMYKRISYIFGFIVNFKELEDPAKSDSFFRIFKKFFDETIDGKVIKRDSPKNIRKFWRSVYSNGPGKDIYRIPSAPPKYEEVFSPEESDKSYNAFVERYNSDMDRYNNSIIRLKTVEEQIAKLDKKLLKAEESEIPQYLKAPAISKLRTHRARLTSEKRDYQSTTKPCVPLYQKIYVDKETEEWKEHNDLMTTGSRKQMIEAGYIEPENRIDLLAITERIKEYLSIKSIKERQYKLRLGVDSKNMLFETDSSDFVYKIKAVECLDSNYDVDSFLLATTNMFLELLNSSDFISNNQYKLIRRTIVGQETRVLCAMVSHCCFGYVSKNFIPLRKKHRRNLCQALDICLEFLR
jgi:hypothetical protein